VSWPCACALWLGSSDLGNSHRTVHGRAQDLAASFRAERASGRGLPFISAIPPSSLQPHIVRCYCPGPVPVPNPAPRSRSRRTYFSCGPLPPATQVYLLDPFQRYYIFNIWFSPHRRLANCLFTPGRTNTRTSCLHQYQPVLRIHSCSFFRLSILIELDSSKCIL
jgi:hypothetical protein